MSWNGSNSVGSVPRADCNDQNPPDRGRGERPARPHEAQGTKHAARSTLLSVLIFALVSAALWWFFGRDAARPQHETPSTKNVVRTIAAVDPQLTTNTIAKKPKSKWPKWWHVPDDWDKPYPPQAYWPDGTLKKHSKYVHVITNDIAEADKSDQERIFTQLADRDIASVLMIEPGTKLVGGDPVFDKSFVKLFLKSCKTPIIINDDDSEYDKELKQAVIEAKKDLKARYDAGEDIAKIMTEAYKEQRELGLYREELENQVAKIRYDNKGKFSDEDVKDLIDSANKMLAERGCKPLECTEIFLQRMKRKALRKAAAGQTKP